MDKNKYIKNLKEHRNKLTHSKHYLDWSIKSTCDVSIEECEDGSIKTSLSYNSKIPSIVELTNEIILANNEIVDCVVNIKDIIFPQRKSFK